MEINDQLLFLFSEEAALQVRAEVVSPAEAAALATAAEAGELRDSAPAAVAIGEDERYELPIFLSRPWSFLHTQLITARLPAHDKPAILLQCFLYLIPLLLGARRRRRKKGVHEAHSLPSFIYERMNDG